MRTSPITFLTRRRGPVKSADVPHEVCRGVTLAAARQRGWTRQPRCSRERVATTPWSTNRRSASTRITDSVNANCRPWSRSNTSAIGACACCSVATTDCHESPRRYSRSSDNHSFAPFMRSAFFRFCHKPPPKAPTVAEVKRRFMWRSRSSTNGVSLSEVAKEAAPASCQRRPVAPPQPRGEWVVCCHRGDSKTRKGVSSSRGFQLTARPA
ncbi:MAG: hypothetical protein JWM63_2836 [Gammaproteobacteria bacterium]|jgi:hypothetical protein|nr:hypothetical protein [Gammaproteobacteria bacterium]